VWGGRVARLSTLRIFSSEERTIMADPAILLTEPHNYAVVQLPGRRFPGVVFQGDSLHTLYLQIGNARKRASKGDDEELQIELDEIFQTLSEVVDHYERTCERNGIELPYSK
jgi:hypothetical protein